MLHIFQGQYKVTNWNFNDDYLPRGMPRNIKVIVTFKAFTNISNKNVEIWHLKIYGELK
jgi:hypothetical protein